MGDASPILTLFQSLGPPGLGYAYRMQASRVFGVFGVFDSWILAGVIGIACSAPLLVPVPSEIPLAAPEVP